jgi:DNA-binding MarR family transcriptional regulator
MLQKEKTCAEDEEIIALSLYKEPFAAPSNPSPNALLEEILLEMHALKEEVLKLREETSRNRQMILAIEKHQESYGFEIRKRIASMLNLIEDYGGAMTSASVKSLMGLSKDEFYRTLKCGRDENLIEIQPNPKDRRGYIIRVKPENRY